MGDRARHRCGATDRLLSQRSLLRSHPPAPRRVQRRHWLRRHHAQAAHRRRRREHLRGAGSGDYFSFLGVTPALGRGFLPGEDAKPGTHSVAVISHAFWQSQFGGAADVIGNTVTLDEKVIEIVGVAPREFTGLDFMQPALWMPASMEKLLAEFTSYRFVGRLSDPGLIATAANLLGPVVADVTKQMSGFAQYSFDRRFQGVHLEPIGRG